MNRGQALKAPRMPVEAPKLRLTGPPHAKRLRGSPVGSNTAFRVHGQVLSHSDGEFHGDQPSAVIRVKRVVPIRKGKR